MIAVGQDLTRLPDSVAEKKTRAVTSEHTVCRNYIRDLSKKEDRKVVFIKTVTKCIF